MNFSKFYRLTEKKKDKEEDKEEVSDEVSDEQPDVEPEPEASDTDTLDEPKSTTNIPFAEKKVCTWHISNSDDGKFLAFIINRDGSSWNITYWSNLFELSSLQTSNISDTHHNMSITFAKEHNVDFYSVIGHHTFAKDYIKTDYWQRLLGENLYGNNEVNINIPNISEFYDQVLTLLPESETLFKN